MTAGTPAEIAAPRLVLTPLQVSDAVEMVAVLSDPVLYGFTGGEPPTVDGLTAQYKFQVAGAPRDGEVWRNWILRLIEGGAAVGFVQATVIDDEADIAWVVGVAWQGNGYASEGAAAMRSWLAEAGVERFAAHIHPDHAASHRVATAIGLRPTGETDDDDEEIWSSEPG